MTLSPSKSSRSRFISWRWRIALPLFLVILTISTIGAYAVAVSFSRGLGASQDNILRESVRGMSNRANNLYRRQLQEAQRVAFTIGVPEAVRLEGTVVLQENLEAMARAAELDSLILTDVSGTEVLGVQRVLLPDVDDYAVNTGTALSGESIVTAALAGTAGAAALFRTPEGTLLYVSTPIRDDDEVVGTVLAGLGLDDVAVALGGTSVASVAVYGANGDLVETTFALNDDIRASLTIPPELAASSLIEQPETVPVRALTLEGQPHRAAYVPFTYGENVLGVVSVLLRDDLPAATTLGRQFVGLMAAAVAGTSVSVVFIGLALYSTRVDRVAETAERLAAGEATARTMMAPTDEAGAAGAALVAYANRV
ncbi:MAG: hypothetical protein AAF125_14770, partial [Chloroflexota bacterium]